MIGGGAAAAVNNVGLSESSNPVSLGWKWIRSGSLIFGTVAKSGKISIVVAEYRSR